MGVSGKVKVLQPVQLERQTKHQKFCDKFDIHDKSCTDLRMVEIKPY